MTIQEVIMKSTIQNIVVFILTVLLAAIAWAELPKQNDNKNEVTRQAVHFSTPESKLASLNQ